MERRLKERLVGAGILVVLIVLVVPELLSGPKGNGATKPAASSGGADISGEPTRTVTVDLNTKRAMTLDAQQEDAATASAQAPPNPNSSAPPPPPPAAAMLPPPQPVPGAAAPPQPAPVPVPAAPGAAPVSGAAPVPSTAIENPAPSSRSWTLQLGSFANRANADQLVRIVKAHNSPAYLSKSGTGTSVRYRVRVGPLADRAAAERMLAKLKSEGHAASVVAP